MIRFKFIFCGPYRETFQHTLLRIITYTLPYIRFRSFSVAWASVIGADNVIIDQISLHEKEKGRKEGRERWNKRGGMSGMIHLFSKVEKLLY